MHLARKKELEEYVQMRRCNHCGQTKAENLFYKDHRGNHYALCGSDAIRICTDCKWKVGKIDDASFVPAFGRGQPPLAVIHAEGTKWGEDFEKQKNVS